MIFYLIVLVVIIILFVFSILWYKLVSESCWAFLLASCTCAIGFMMLLLFCVYPIKCNRFENRVEQMRINPQNFSVQDASAVNKDLTDIAHYQNTIFTWHQGFDTTLLDLSQFVNI